MIQQPQAPWHRAPSGTASRFASLLLSLALLTGCGEGAHGAAIPRTLAGKPHVGHFVPPFAYEAYVRGELALARGDAAAAVAALELATAAPDEDVYLLSRLAWAHALAGDAESAERTLQRAAQLDACSEAVWTTRARLAERARDLPRARDAYAESSRCAPHSALGPLGLSRTLVALGERERAQAVLEAFALRSDSPQSYEAALALALSRGDGVAVGAALEGLLTSAAPRADTLSAAIEQALTMERPLLAARLSEHARPGISPVLAARVCLARGDVACAQARLAMTATDALGSIAEAAELLVAAQLFERAELEASVALTRLPSPRLYLARARARAALGDMPGALDDLGHVESSAEARALLVELTRKAGMLGLAQELSAPRTANAQ